MDWTRSRSEKLYEQACTLMPGGVNSPVRSFKGMGTTPAFIKSGRGPYLIDEDGHEYVDYICSWGPLLHGHCYPSIRNALENQLSKGWTYGAPTEVEIHLAELVRNMMPCMQMMRMVNSGTEATMSAIRLARGATKRKKIIKFNGCYHGHGDSLLVQMGSGGLTFGEPNSPGVLADLAQHTLVAEYNDLAQVESLFREYGSDIAGIILEPIPGNMGLLFPQQGFLEGLRALCDKFESILIFDEVMTGFRVAEGGACEVYGVQPDLVCLGKVIGGGLPVGAYGGKRELMEQISPTGGVYQAGTLSGNPLAMVAGFETLKKLQELKPWKQFEDYMNELAKVFTSAAARAKIDIQFSSMGSMFGFFFHPGPVSTKLDVDKCDFLRFKRFFVGMLERGVYFAPSQYEAGFLSTVHGAEELKRTITSIESCMETLDS